MTRLDRSADSAKTGLARSAGLVGMATSASRVLGLVREQVQAFLFGAGDATDAFNVAFRIPNLLRDLFAEGALSSSFVPTFTSALEREGVERAFVLGRRVAGILILVVGLLCLAGLLFTPTLVRCIAPGLWETPGKGELTVLLTRIMLPFLLLIALAAQAMGMLNSLGSFVLPAFAPVMLNLGSIVVGSSLALLAPRFSIPPVAGLAIGIMVGGFGQLAIQLPPLVRKGLSLKPEISFTDPGVRQIVSLMTPAAIGLAATQINILVNTQIASYLVEGSISWLTYAFRLMQFPIGLFGVSVATVMLPTVSRLLAVGQKTEAGEAVRRSMRLVLSFAIPASVGLALLAHPIVALLYQYRRFLPQDTTQTANALLFYALGLTGFSLVKVLVPVFYALGETRIPVRASFIAVGANIVLNLLLMHPMGHLGLALATSVTGLTNFAILAVSLASRLDRCVNREDLVFVAKLIGASFTMGVSVEAVSSLVIGWHFGVVVLDRLVAVFVPAALGVVVFGATAKLVAIPEVDEIISIFRKKCRRSEFSRA